MGFNTPSKIQETALPMLLADPSVFIFLLCCCTIFVLSVLKGDLGNHLTVMNIMCKLMYMCFKLELNSPCNLEKGHST